MQSLLQVQHLSQLTLLRQVVQAPTCFSNILLQHTQPPHCRAKREEATGSSAVPDMFQPRGNIHKSTHSIFQNYPHDLTWQKGVEKFGEQVCFLETVNISAKWLFKVSTSHPWPGMKMDFFFPFIFTPFTLYPSPPHLVPWKAKWCTPLPTLTSPQTSSRLIIREQIQKRMRSTQ